MITSNKPLYLNDWDIKFWIGRIMVTVLYVNYEPPIPGWGYDYHVHSSYELHYISKGEGVLEADNRQYPIGPGTLFLTGPGIYHKQSASLTNPMSEFCINFEFKSYTSKEGKHIYYLQEEVGEILSILKDNVFWFGQYEFDVDALFEELLEELLNRKFGRFILIQNLISEILIKTLRNFMKYQETKYQIPLKITNDRRRLTVDRFFREQPVNNCNPESLARSLGVSVRQLNRIIQDYYGMTFKEKERTFRLERAKDLLCHTKLSISEIAKRTGFEENSYFCKIFKKQTQMTPTAYRKSKLLVK